YELEIVRHTLELSPLVTGTMRETLMELNGLRDSEKHPPGCPGFECRWAFDLIKLFDAYRYIDAYRARSGTTGADLAPVNIAVLDSGFQYGDTHKGFKDEFADVTINFVDFNQDPAVPISEPDNFSDVGFPDSVSHGS